MEVIEADERLEQARKGEITARVLYAPRYLPDRQQRLDGA